MKMQHAELIAYAAQHPDGWDSLEWRNNQCNTQTDWRLGGDEINPAYYPKMQWRIKPDTLKISVEIPKPDCGPEDGWTLCVEDETFHYSQIADRDEAARILIEALRGGK